MKKEIKKRVRAVKEKTITPETGLEQPESAWRAGEVHKQDYTHDLEFLSRSALAFYELPPDGDIYQLIVKLLSDMLRNDAILAIGDYDEKSDMFQLRAIHGIENTLGALKKILGKDPFELSGDFGPVAKMALATGKLTRVDRGLKDFSDKLLTEPVAKAVEKLLGLTGFYVMGFNKAGRIQGGLSIITRKQTALPDPALVEAFAVQAAIEIEKRRAEEALRESRKRFQALTETTSDFIWEMDANGVYTYCSPQIYELWGYKPEDMIGRTPFERMIPEDRKLASKMFRTRLESPSSFKGMETRSRDKNGRMVVVETSGVPFFGTDGGLLGYRGISRDISERKRAEEALRESEERFRTLYENSTIGLYRTTPDGRIHLANSALIRMLGYSSFDDLSTRNLEKDGFEPFYPRTQFVEMIEKNGEVKGLESAWKRKDGTTIFIRESARAIRDSRAKTLYYDGTVEDITERKRAEEALVKSEEDYRELANSLPMCIFDTDPSGRLTYANQTAFEWFGYSKAELLAGTNVLQMLAEEDRQRGAENFRRVLSAGEMSTGEYLALRKDGLTFPVLVTSRVIQKDGQPVGLRGIVVDITERKKAEDALRASEQLYRSLIDVLPEGVALSDLSGKLTYVSPRLASIYGEAIVEEAVGTNALQWIAPEYREKALANTQSLLRNEIPSDNEYVLLKKDGTRFFGEINGTLLMDAEGRPKGLVTVHRDITGRRRAEERLRQSMAQIRNTLKAAINSLSSAIEMRDPYTAGHQERVTMLACAIGKEMGLPQEQIEAIQIAGIVHDIGKLSIPAEILSKPTKLSDVEFSLIKTHAYTGYTILNKIEFPWPVAQIVYQHHERIDGSGYPNGISGKDMLIEAKILCVADVVEAMSSHRPYRPAMGVETALEEISQNRGALYDPDVADACMRLFAEKGFRFD